MGTCVENFRNLTVFFLVFLRNIPQLMRLDSPFFII